MHRNLGKYIDHSPLCSDITHEDIIKFCDEAKTYGFCSVVVHPIYISTAFKELSDTDIKVVSVAGFPFGTDFTDMKAMETQRWISYGATEIDMVMNIGALKEKNYDYVRNDMKEVVNAADKKAGIKVTMFIDSAAQIALTAAQDKEEKTKPVDIVLLGADAITKIGVANKVGSGIISQIAKDNKIPVYIISDSLKYSKKKVQLEQRNTKEVWKRSSVRLENPAFELIKKENVTGIISELGILNYNQFLKKGAI